MSRNVTPVIWLATIRYFDQAEGLQEKSFTVETSNIDGLAATRLVLDALESERQAFGSAGAVNTLELYCSIKHDD